MKILRFPVADLPKGLPGFVRWMKSAHPQVHRAVAARLAANNLLGDLGLTLPGEDPVVNMADASATKPGIGQQIVNVISDIAKVGLPIYQQQKIFDLQLARMKAGQQPLDTQAISDASALRFGVDSGTKNTGLIIAGILGAAVLGFALLRR